MNIEHTPTLTPEPQAGAPEFADSADRSMQSLLILLNHEQEQNGLAHY